MISVTVLRPDRPTAVYVHCVPGATIQDQSPVAAHEAAS